MIPGSRKPGSGEAARLLCVGGVQRKEDRRDGLRRRWLERPRSAEGERRSSRVRPGDVSRRRKKKGGSLL